MLAQIRDQLDRTLKFRFCPRPILHVAVQDPAQGSVGFGQGIVDRDMLFWQILSRRSSGRSILAHPRIPLAVGFQEPDMRGHIVDKMNCFLKIFDQLFPLLG